MSGMRVLVIEDEFLVGLEVQSLLSEAGFDVVGPAATVPDALRRICSTDLDAAVVDGNLGGQSTEEIGAALADRGTPFVVLTGYGRENLPPSLVNARFMEKPFDSRVLVDTVQRPCSRFTVTLRLSAWNKICTETFWDS